MLGRLVVTAKSLYVLTKPGIIRGNLWHAFAGMLFAPVGDSTLLAAAGLIGGMTCVIASACLLNNYFDRRFDQKMTRTQHRPTATGAVGGRLIAVSAALSLICGIAVLAATTNTLTVMLALLAYVTYVFIYTFSKPYTAYSALIGALPGALPVLAGYTAMTDSFAPVAWVVFAVVFVWQLPHFYAISVFRKTEYQAANLPVLSTVVSFGTMRQIIVATIILYCVVAILGAWNTMAAVSALLMTLVSVWWVWSSAKPLGRMSPAKWARRVFGGSMVASLALVGAALLDLGSRVLM